MDNDGASPNERLLYAARTDDEDLLLEVFENSSTFDINCTDSLGNTPLHLAAAHGSTTNLEHILSHEYCDVDPQNSLEKATPLHLALKIDEPELRFHIVDSLLEAGANTSIKNKQGYTVLALLGDRDPKLRELVRRAQGQGAMSRDDIAKDDDDDDDSSGSDSASN